MTSPAETAGRSRQWQELLDQLEYLLVEVDALVPLLQELPIEVLQARLFDDPSILEAFVEMALRDWQAVHLIEGGKPAEPPFDYEAQSGQRIAGVLDFLRSARTRLLATLRAADQGTWDVEIPVAGDRNATPFDLAYDLAQQDAQVLRSMAERLRTARLSDRPRAGSS